MGLFSKVGSTTLTFSGMLIPAVLTTKLLTSSTLSPEKTTHLDVENLNISIFEEIVEPTKAPLSNKSTPKEKSSRSGLNERKIKQKTSAKQSGSSGIESKKSSQSNGFPQGNVQNLDQLQSEEKSGDPVGKNDGSPQSLSPEGDIKEQINLDNGLETTENSDKSEDTVVGSEAVTDDLSKSGKKEGEEDSKGKDQKTNEENPQQESGNKDTNNSDTAPGTEEDLSSSISKDSESLTSSVGDTEEEEESITTQQEFKNQENVSAGNLGTQSVSQEKESDKKEQHSDTSEDQDLKEINSRNQTHKQEGFDDVAKPSVQPVSVSQRVLKPEFESFLKNSISSILQK